MENDPLTRVAEPGGTVTSRSDEAGPPVVTALDETPAAQGWGVAVPAAPRPLESAAERRRAIDATGGFFGRPGRRRR